MSATATHDGHGSTLTDATHLGKNRGAMLMKAAAALAAVGFLMAAAAAFSDHKKFAAAYLTGFMWVTTIGLGGLFFVLIQHITRAGWSVGPRRQAEWLAGFLPIVAILFIPIIAFNGDLFGAWMHPHGEHAEVVLKKAGYLNATFFFVRAGIYLLAWFVLGHLFRTTSLKQDESGDAKLTNKMGGWAAPSILVFALTLTFAGFDWIMSLNPTWYSTIFGVYIFAGSVTSSLALLALMTIGLRRSGLFVKVVTVEHQHDLGKLLFGFTVFWAYIAFSQFFLIWYANIPEETIFFVERWEPGWRAVSMSLVFGHFWIPFFLLLSRHAKRSFLALGIGAVLHLVMHYVDLYWLIVPNFEEHPNFGWIEIAGLLFPAGILAVWLAWRASKDALYPLKDPRLHEAYKTVNY